MTRSPLVKAVVALASLPIGHLAGLGLGVASAHEGDGVLVVESQGPANGMSVPYVVRLTWEDDGHAAVDATVTATAIAADGTPQTPVPLEPVDQEGLYVATLTYPAAGSWTVRFTSVTPAATTEVAEEVAEPTTTTADSTTSTTTGTTRTTDQVSGEGSPDDEGVGVGGVLAAAFLVVVVVACVIGFTRSTRRIKADR